MIQQSNLPANLPAVRYRLFKVIIHTSDAFILYLITMFAAYLLTAWKPSLPFLAFASQVTIGLGALLAKRHLANKEETKYANSNSQVK